MEWEKKLEKKMKKMKTFICFAFSWCFLHGGWIMREGESGERMTQVCRGRLISSWNFMSTEVVVPVYLAAIGVWLVCQTRVRRAAEQASELHDRHDVEMPATTDQQTSPVSSFSEYIYTCFMPAHPPVWGRSVCVYVYMYIGIYIWGLGFRV